MKKVSNLMEKIDLTTIVDELSENQHIEIVVGIEERVHALYLNKL